MVKEQMMISTKGRYALRILIDLAENDDGRYIPLKDLAERQKLSVKYLESIISVLSKADYLEGLRGKGGGYKIHCSVLAEEAVKSAVKNYYDRNNIAYDPKNFPDCKKCTNCRFV